MLYTYTWSHISLFAQLCGCPDTVETLTENWVRFLERQQEQTFPFTLWPLTYRTSAVMASTSLRSPTMARIAIEDNNHVARLIRVKFYVSNDVIIMCFQHEGEIVDQCKELCVFGSPKTRDGHCLHSSKADHPLVPCHIMTTYSKIKKKVMIELMKCQGNENTSDSSETSCIICTGYDVGAVLAGFMARELANDFRMEAEFMGQKESSVKVDCVGFSPPESGNDKYWTEFESLIDNHITVRHEAEKMVSYPRNPIFIGNRKLSTHGLIKNSSRFNKSRSAFKKKNKNIETIEETVPWETYIRGIDEKINLLISTL